MDGPRPAGRNPSKTEERLNKLKVLATEHCDDRDVNLVKRPFAVVEFEQLMLAILANYNIDVAQCECEWEDLISDAKTLLSLLI